MTTEQPPKKVELAQEPDFSLGGLMIRPSACRIRAGGREVRVEPRVMEVLVVLVRAAGRTVSRDELIAACWDGRAVSDDAVTRVIAKMRGLASVTEPPAFALETVPKVGFRLTPGAAASEPRPDRTLRPIYWTVLALLATVLALGAAWIGARRQVVAGQVEVAPFAAEPADHEGARLAAGLDEAILGRLSSGGVQAVVEGAGRPELRIVGALSRDGSDYVVASRVIDGRTGTILWSAQLSRPAAQAAGLADDVAIHLAGAISCGLQDRGREPLQPVVVGLLLQACEAQLNYWPERMLGAARRLVAVAPRMATAQAKLGLAAGMAARNLDHRTAESVALRRLAARAAARARELDPHNPEAYVALALSYGEGGAWLAREAALERALAIDPERSCARLAYVQFLREVGRLDEAIEIGRSIGAMNDPRGSGSSLTLAMMLAQRGELDEAEKVLAELERVIPEQAQEIRWTNAVWWEDPATAVPKVLALKDGAEAACLAKFLEDLPSLKATGARGTPAGCESLVPDWRARLLARQGDIEGAYAALARPLPNSRRMTAFLFYPEMKGFRQAPRFMPLAKQLGLADYWRESGRWPDFCAEPDLPYDCKAEAAK